MSAKHYLEIVTNDVPEMRTLYERTHGLSFGEPAPELGGALVAELTDGSLVGIRAPLAEHEEPIMRTYLEVADIGEAAQAAEAAGGMVAYPPTDQSPYGKFAIIIFGDVQHGLWEPPITIG